MAEFIIEHEWSPENTERVVQTVNGIVEMAKSSKLPAGFQLKGINVVADQTRAFCTWDAPSKRAISDLVQKVNPPTKWSVFELNKMY